LILAKDERPLIYYRLGAAPDKEPLSRSAGDVDGLVVGGHLFAWGQSWISLFLQKMKKPFFVDPMSYIFAKDPSFIVRDGSLRKSYDALKDWFNWKVKEVAGKRPLRPEDFDNGGNEEAIKEFVVRVLEFQRRIPRVDDRLQNSLEKYGEIMGEDLLGERLLPQFYLSPYFHATDLDDPWYRITMECAHVASGIEDYEPLVPVLCLSESFIAEKHGREQICNDLSGFELCVLWISGLDEFSSSLESLRAFKLLVEELADSNVGVINMYGGYLSLLLYFSGVGVTCSGPAYGESKSADWVATGGGFPDRYYIPRAKRIVVEANARTFLSRNPEFLCDCEVCGELTESIGMDSESTDFPHQLDYFFQELRGAKTRMHYIRCRARESAMVGTSKPDALRDNLLQCQSELGDADSTTLGVPTDHLERWASLL